MTALIKDALREIPRSFGRFMSMLLIILVGCGFFTGLRASRSDMILTAREYFEESRLMDLRLRSGIGIRSDEISAVRSAENVKGAYAGYTKDLFYHYDDQNIVVKAFSLTESVTEDSPHYLNRTVLLEGRMPESSDECVVERKMSSPDTFRVGNSITLISPDAPMDEVLAQDTFKIVGIVISPVFIGFERDASFVGNGSVNSNIFLMESAFRLDYYTDMYVALEGTEGMDPFSEEYRKACEKLGEPAMNAFRQSLQKRYDKLKSDAENEVKTAEDTIALTEKVLSASPEELEMLHRQASAALDNAKETYGESESIIAKAAIVNAEKKLRMLEELMADEMGSVRAELISQTESARSDIEKGRKQLKEAPELRTLCETRFAQNDYSSYRDDADKIYNVSKAFPLFFVLRVGDDNAQIPYLRGGCICGGKPFRFGIGAQGDTLYYNQDLQDHVQHTRSARAFQARICAYGVCGVAGADICGGCIFLLQRTEGTAIIHHAAQASEKRQACAS